jgi:hypothetical protein
LILFQLGNSVYDTGAGIIVEVVAFLVFMGSEQTELTAAAYFITTDSKPARKFTRQELSLLPESFQRFGKP